MGRFQTETHQAIPTILDNGFKIPKLQDFPLIASISHQHGFPNSGSNKSIKTYTCIAQVVCWLRNAHVIQQSLTINCEWYARLNYGLAPILFNSHYRVSSVCLLTKRFPFNGVNKWYSKHVFPLGHNPNPTIIQMLARPFTLVCIFSKRSIRVLSLTTKITRKTIESFRVSFSIRIPVLELRSNTHH